MHRAEELGLRIHRDVSMTLRRVRRGADVPTVLRWVLFAATLPVTAYAGDPCGGVEVSRDPFTGGMKAEAVVMPPSQFNAIGLALELREGTPTLRVTVKEFGALDGQVGPGAEILFRLENGAIVSFRTVAPAVATPYVVGSGVMTNITYALPLDEASLAALGAAPVTLIRLPLVSTGTTTDWDPKGSTSSKLQAALMCFASLESGVAPPPPPPPIRDAIEAMRTGLLVRAETLQLPRRGAGSVISSVLAEIYVRLHQDLPEDPQLVRDWSAVQSLIEVQHVSTGGIVDRAVSATRRLPAGASVEQLLH